jgi:hypothetical protein
MDVGTVDKPKSYVKGVFPMKWGLYKNLYTGNTEVVFFGGQNENKTIGLGGSSRHVIGTHDLSTTDSSSLTPYLLDFLRNELKLRDNPEKDMHFGKDEDDRERHAISAIDSAIDDLYGPVQQLEFLAKTLLVWHTDNGYTLLGTPLYVALAD